MEIYVSLILHFFLFNLLIFFLYFFLIPMTFTQEDYKNIIKLMFYNFFLFIYLFLFLFFFYTFFFTNVIHPHAQPTTGQYKTRTADCGLRTTDCGLGIKHGLGIKRGLRTMYIKTALGFRKVNLRERKSGLA